MKFDNFDTYILIKKKIGFFQKISNHYTSLENLQFIQYDSNYYSKNKIKNKNNK